MSRQEKTPLQMFAHSTSSWITRLLDLVFRFQPEAGPFTSTKAFNDWFSSPPQLHLPPWTQTRLPLPKLITRYRDDQIYPRGLAQRQYHNIFDQTSSHSCYSGLETGRLVSGNIARLSILACMKVHGEFLFPWFFLRGMQLAVVNSWTWRTWNLSVCEWT